MANKTVNVFLKWPRPTKRNKPEKLTELSKREKIKHQNNLLFTTMKPKALHNPKTKNKNAKITFCFFVMKPKTMNAYKAKIN